MGWVVLNILRRFNNLSVIMATLKQELLNLGNQKGETKIRTPEPLDPARQTALPLHHHRSPQEKERDWSKNYDTFFHTLNAHLQKYKQGADQTMGDQSK